MIIGKSDDFRSFVAFGGPDREAPFFVPVKEASIKASGRVFLAPVTPRPGHARCAPVCLPAPTVGNDDGRSDARSKALDWYFYTVVLPSYPTGIFDPALLFRTVNRAQDRTSVSKLTDLQYLSTPF